MEEKDSYIHPLPKVQGFVKMVIYISPIQYIWKGKLAINYKPQYVFGVECIDLILNSYY